MKKIILFTLIISLSVIILFGCKKSDSTKTAKNDTHTEQTETIVIASKPMGEQYILAEMLAYLIESKTSLKVEKKLGIGGGTSNIHPAMIAGEIDMYPEYTGTAWLFVLKNQPIKDAKELYNKVSKAYNDEFDIYWSGLYGFNNTYRLAVRKDTAEKYNLKTYSDLAKHSADLRFGANYDFYEREDGYPGVSKTYGFNFKKKAEMDIGLRFSAIEGKQVDVIPAYSTDPQIKKFGLVVLQDDKDYFPSYHAATLVRNETLKKYPELKDVVNLLDGQISDEEMLSLNYLQDIEHQDPKNIAIDFLKKKGIIQ